MDGWMDGWMDRWMDGWMIQQSNQGTNINEVRKKNVISNKTRKNFLIK